YAWAHQDEVFPLLKQYAQELDREVIFKHIETYVNQYTYKLNDEAKKGLSIFFESLGLEDVLEAYIWEVKDGIS
ncbi:MAG: MqnA/MqnD/SBP family protein, partial [Caldimicrobium sp.]